MCSSTKRALGLWRPAPEKKIRNMMISEEIHVCIAQVSGGYDGAFKRWM